MNPPISFQQMAQQGGTPANGGYPYQIRASDLDKNFVFATLDVAPSLVETSTGQGGHPQRRLKIPNPPEEAEGLFLQADLSWSEPVEKGNFKGQFLKWDPQAKKWVPFSGSADGAFPQWDATNGWESQGAGTVDNELLRWNATSDTWEPFGRGATDGQLLVAQSGGWVPFSAPTSEKTVLTANGGTLSWEAAIPDPPSGGTHVLGSVGGTLQWIATEEC